MERDAAFEAMQAADPDLEPALRTWYTGGATHFWRDAAGNFSVDVPTGIACRHRGALATRPGYVTDPRAAPAFVLEGSPVAAGCQLAPPSVVRQTPGPE